jgi:hypothetical protein
VFRHKQKLEELLFIIIQVLQWEFLVSKEIKDRVVA